VPATPPDNEFGTPPAVPPAYKQKLAVYYIRQSTLDQVKNNTGSTESQRALADRALWYGWPPEQIRGIDEDLGLSGTSSAQRTGFQRLLTMMDQGEVGLVLVRDAARLSRNRFDTASFWRSAILADVLVEVNGRLRRPALDRATDRFGLEIETLLAWYENEQRTEMFQAARRAKIAQGRAITAPPMGYVKAGQGEWEKGPDPAVSTVIRQVVDAYLQFASLRKARRHLHAQGVRFPRRVRGRIEWEALTDGHLYRVLSNPNYTPDYTFRRSRTVQRPAGTKHQELRPRDEWLVVPDHHEGYMTREEWDRVQSLLQKRRSTRQPFPGKGAGLLQGLLFCGRCGRWMRTVYDGRPETNPSGRLARYRCAPADKFGTEQHRLSCSAAGIDHVVVGALLRALAPPDLTDALTAIRGDQQQQDAAALARRRHLHRAEERVYDLKRRYLEIDSSRHLLKLELEQDLEAALQDLRRLRQPVSEDGRSRTITEADAAELVRLATDLKTLWSAITTTNEERKRILSTAIEKVVLHDNDTDALEVQIIWAGGLTERLPLLKRPGGTKLIKKMIAEGRTKGEILTALTEQGLTAYQGGPLTPKALSRMYWGLGLGMKKPRLEALRRIRDMVIEGRARREILQVLQTQGPQPEEGEWTFARLRWAIKSLKLGVWGQTVPPLPSGTPRLRKLELPVIRLFAERRKAGRSFRKISEEFNALGFRTPRGQSFTERSARFLYRGLQQDPALAAMFACDDPSARRHEGEKAPEQSTDGASRVSC